MIEASQSANSTNELTKKKMRDVNEKKDERKKITRSSSQKNGFCVL